MFKLVKLLFMFSVLVIVLSVSVDVFATVEITSQAGWNIFDPIAEGGSYRYGPSIIINADGSIDMWSSSEGVPGSPVNWDYIRYRRSTDGGHTWTADVVTLTPTTGGRDEHSVCDPGVFKYGSYYYIGYTSTENDYGLDNDVYVGRSTSASGPWDKWNGSGWGGNPQPIIEHTGPTSSFGTGEPSFVVKDGTLYIYFTWLSEDANGNPISQTRVSTAPMTDNWPANMTYRGIAINRSEEEDSTDVKYIDAYGKFIAIASMKRFTPDAYINVWESTDGLVFKPANMPKKSLSSCLHNAGISSRGDGHINLSDSNFVAYSFGDRWACWATNINPITFSNNSLPAVPEVYSVHESSGQILLNFETVAGVNYKVKYGTTSGSYTNVISGITSSPYTITGLTNGTTYYVVVSAYNANGESANSVQYTLRPLAYSDSPRVAATASSYISGWEISKAIDNDPNTCWSSTAHTVSSSTEWIRVDTGAPRAIKRVTLTPRQRDLKCYSGDVQVSMDGNTWEDVKATIYTLKDTNTRYVVNFDKPIWARYVRLYSEVLRFDAYYNYYLQVANIKIEEVPYTATASSTLSGWNVGNVIDDNANTIWSSVPHNDAASTEWLCIDNGATASISGIKLLPRESGISYPVDYKFQYSIDGSTWIDVPGKLFTNVANPGGALQVYPFSSPVTARYVRMYATKLRSDGSAYYCQLAGFSLIKDIEYMGFTAAANSTLSGWDVYKAIDRDSNTCWSSNAYTSASNTEWLTVGAGSNSTIYSVTVTPRGSGICFPVDFKFQYSNDNSTFIDVPGQSYTNYAQPGSSPITFTFSISVTAKYIRMYVTKLRSDGGPGYYCQLVDMVLNTGTAAVYTTSYISGLESYKLNDESKDSVWSSAVLSQGNSTKISFDLGAVKSVGKILISPREQYCFPKDFKIEYSTDNITWYTVPGMDFKDFLYAFTATQKFEFTSPVSARYIRINATRFTPDDYGNYYMQFSEVVIQ